MGRSKIRRFAAGLSAAILVACNEIAVELPTATTLEVSPASLSLVVGDGAQLSAQVLDQSGTVVRGAVVLWSSDKPEVVAVLQDGSVAARSAGSAKVTAKHGGLSADVAVTVTGAGSVVVTPGSAQLFPGSSQTLTALVYGPKGQLITPSVTWTSLNPAVATVGGGPGATQAVIAQAEGTTSVIAEALGARDTVPVQVVRDARLLIASVNIVPDSAAIDVSAPLGPLQVEFRAPNFRGTETCNSAPPLAYRFDPSVIAGVFALGGITCRIQINVAAPGGSWVVASVNNVRDSVWVTVTDIVAGFVIVPHDTLMKAGDTVTYQGKVVDASSRASAANARFTLSVTGGRLSSQTVTANANGEATVSWYLPQFPIDASGTSHTISGFVTLANGAVSPSADDTRTIMPGPAASARLFINGNQFTGGPARADTLAGSLSVPLGRFPLLYARSFDRFGNARVTRALFSTTDPSTISGNSASGTFPGAVFTTLRGDRLRTETVTAAEGSASASVAVTWTVGPEIVYQPFSNEVWTGQATYASSLSDTLVYNGTAGAAAYPVMTLRSDTVAFAWFNGGNWDVGLVRSNGGNAGAPVSGIADTRRRASATWGFPAFRSAAGNPAGAVVFLSNRDSTKIANARFVWDLYIGDRNSGAATKVTNTHPDSNLIRYRGLSLSPDESRALIVSDLVGARMSQVYEVVIASGAITAITSNTSTSTTYRYAAYSPDGLRIYIDRTNAGVRELVEKSGTTFRVIKQGSAAVELQPSFNPTDPNTLAYLAQPATAGDIRIFPLPSAENVTVDQVGRGSIQWFSWARR